MAEPASTKLKLQASFNSEDAIRDAVNSILPADDVPTNPEYGSGSEYTSAAAENGDSGAEANCTGMGKEDRSQSPLARQEDIIEASNTPEPDRDEVHIVSRSTLDGILRNTSDNVNPSDPENVGATCAIVAAHYNNLEERGLEEREKSRIVHLRNFNNWTKSMLIDEYLTKVKDSKSSGSPLRVLDMGCGKGGDLFKWRKGNITHLVCADIAGTSIEQCKERYQDMARRAQNERHFNRIFSAEFIVANCTKDRLREQYKDVTLELDLVSCQFAFHYCFESLPQAECMLRNASECLRPGGYFIGTCPNANTIMSRLRKAGGKKFGNEIYSVEFETELSGDMPPPLFGAKYNFHMEGVVDCPEFLVHFPTFIRLASKYNLELVACETFASHFERMKETGRGLLGKMQALETYPPFPEQTLSGSPSEYQHAEDYIKRSGTHRKLGTLTKSEWEAATLYLIFAFKKMKKH